MPHIVCTVSIPVLLGWGKYKSFGGGDIFQGVSLGRPEPDLGPGMEDHYEGVVATAAAIKEVPRKEVTASALL